MINVIVPIYNGGNFIKSCISSFEKQTYKDFLVIFVDDGSTDETKEIIEDIRIKTSIHIQLIVQSNQGVSAARNAGIEHSTGKYLSFVDVDDTIEPTYLEDLLLAIELNEIDVAFCMHKTIKNQKEQIYAPDSGIIKVMTGNDFLVSLLYGHIRVGCWSLIVKKSFVEENKICFPLGYKHWEDLYFVYNLAIHSKNIAVIEKKLYNYIFQPFSATSRFGESRLKAIELVNKVLSDIKKKELACANIFTKHMVPKYYWTLSWQACVYMKKKDCLIFLNHINIKKYFKALTDFPVKKVALSSAIGKVSICAFRVIAIKKGKNALNS